MNAEHLLEIWNPKHQDAFNDALQEFLCENEGEVPLDEICDSGGGPDPEESAEYEVIETTETDETLTSEVSASFNESIATSCPDFNFRERQQGTLTVKIDKATGDLTFDIAGGRNLEDY